MRIIVDGYGGDGAPEEVLKGAAEAVRTEGFTILMTGDEAELRAKAGEIGVSVGHMEFFQAPDVIPMEADPTSVLKRYRHSSMAAGLSLLAEGKGDAFVSGGNTGALTVGGTLIVRRLRGVRRPAIGTVIPCRGGRFLLIDTGANHDCRPEMLVQFGLMGSIYMERIEGVPNPRVGLMNIGTEDSKGRALQVSANRLMREADYNYIGNIEARDVPLGGCDVAVCDGFTGNIFLKTLEGTLQLVLSELRTVFLSSLKNRSAALLVRGDIGELKKRFSASEHGGALLMGTRAPIIKAHGNSDARAFLNAIRQAGACCERGILPALEKALG